MLPPRRIVLTLVLLSAVGGVLLTINLFRHHSGAPAAVSGADATLAVPVPAIPVRVQPMPVILQAVGQVVSAHMVQIRPQVAGMLKQVFFVEGRIVSAGQPLYLIEPAPFEAALAAARAAWQNAKGNADQMEKLVGQGYVIPQEYRNARALADQAEAAFKQAQINLSYTDIRAPVTGRTGGAAVKSGNIVSPTDAAPLVIINQMAPIQVQFSIPQQFLGSVRRHLAHDEVRVRVSADTSASPFPGDPAAGRDPADPRPAQLPSARTDAASGGDWQEGALVFVDNTVNTNTGTVLLKAQLANEREQLWPGQFVNVTVQLAIEPRAIVIPQTAVQTGQTGNYVYVIADDRVRMRPVRVDRQIGTLAVISAGLAGNEQVVARVPRSLRDGVKVIPGSDTAPPPAQVTLSGHR